MALYQRASREIQNPLSLSPCNRARGKAQTRSERKECVRSTQIDRALGPKPSEIVNSDTGRHPSITVREATITGLESIKKGKGYWVALYQRATREMQNSLSPYPQRPGAPGEGRRHRDPGGAPARSRAISSDLERSYAIPSAPTRSDAIPAIPIAAAPVIWR